jgi:transposase
MATLSVGIDMAKATFTAACWRDGRGQGVGTYPNTPAGFAALADRLDAEQRDGESLHLVLEPTAGYELALAGFACQRGWQVSLPNPKQVRDWARGIGRRAKSDTLDAVLLAQYGAERRPPCWHPLAAEVAELESLLRRKDDVEQMIRQERNRQHALAGRPNVAGAVPDTISRVIAALDETLLALEEAIAAHLRAHAALHEDAKRLRSVPGIGAKNVAYILVLLHRCMTLTAGEGTQKGLAASIGLDPQTYESGTSVRRRAAISRMGDQAIRRRLFMGAWGGVRGDNPLRTFYQRLVGRGKPKMVALIAAARKLLTWAWAVFRRQVLFDATRNAPATTITIDANARAYACASAA